MSSKASFVHIPDSLESHTEIRCRVESSITSDRRAQFDLFVDHSPYPSYQQSTSWPKIAPLTKLQSFVYVSCESNGTIILFGLLRLTKLTPGRYLGLFQRGPIFMTVADLHKCLPVIKQNLRDIGVCSLLLHPRWEDDDAGAVSDVLKRNGFKEQPRGAVSLHGATALVDLRPDPDVIFAGFHKRCRNGLRQAEKKGLTVREATTQEDAIKFRDIFLQMADLRKMDTLGQADIVKQWESVRSDEDGVVLLAIVEEQIIGGIVVVREGNRALIRGGGSLPLYPKIPRLHSLIWTAMLMMKERGCEFLDMGGSPESDEIDDGEARRAMFKKAFNAKGVVLVKPFLYPVRPLSHAFLYRLREIYRRSPLRRFLGKFIKK